MIIQNIIDNMVNKSFIFSGAEQPSRADRYNQNAENGSYLVLNDVCH